MFGPLVSPVGNRLNITAGNGSNTATVFCKAGGQILYQGGSGTDDVTFGGATNNNLFIFLGAGNDTFTFAPGTAINSGYIDFGADADTYVPNGVFVGGSLTLFNLP